MVVGAVTHMSEGNGDALLFRGGKLASTSRSKSLPRKKQGAHHEHRGKRQFSKRGTAPGGTGIWPHSSESWPPDISAGPSPGPRITPACVRQSRQCTQHSRIQISRSCRSSKTATTWQSIGGPAARTRARTWMCRPRPERHRHRSILPPFRRREACRGMGCHGTRVNFSLHWASGTWAQAIRPGLPPWHHLKTTCSSVSEQ